MPYRSEGFPWYQALRRRAIAFYLDQSSVQPHFEIRNETCLIESTFEENFTTMLEYNEVVQIPPKRKYRIELEVKSIRRAEPKFIEPDTF